MPRVLAPLRAKVLLRGADLQSVANPWHKQDRRYGLQIRSTTQHALIKTLKKQIVISSVDKMKYSSTLLTVLLLPQLAASTAAEPKPFVEAIPARENAESGSKVVQLTSQPVISTNVHMEQRFTSADGRRIAIERQPFGQAPELWVCDLGTTRLYRIGAGRAMTASFSRNAIYYLTPSPEAQLMWLNLADLSTGEIMSIPDDAVPRKLAISHDERWGFSNTPPFQHSPFGFLEGFEIGYLLLPFTPNHRVLNQGGAVSFSPSIHEAPRKKTVEVDAFCSNLSRWSPGD